MFPKSPKLKLSLPGHVGINDISALFLVCSQIKSSVADIELDCSRVRFFDPFGMTVLVSALESISDKYQISMPWLSVNIASYLERMDFFARLDVQGVEIPKGRARHDQGHSLMEVTLLRNTDKAEEVADRLATAVVGRIVGRSAKDGLNNAFQIEVAARDFSNAEVSRSVS